MNTLVVNLIGGPGIGKSAIAAGVFSKLKWNLVNAELVTEFAKDVTHEENFKIFDDQLFVLANQFHRIKRLLGKYDVVINDSPLLNSIAFLNEKQYELFEPFTLELFNSTNNLNVLVKRCCPYHTVGRIQTEEESKALDVKFLQLLERNEIPWIAIEGTEEGQDILYKKLFTDLKTKNAN
jgi:hypothetical protein